MAARRKATAPAEPTQLPIDTRWVAIDAVTPNPANIRHDLGDVSELADSISEHGVLQPLVVHVDADNADGLVVIMGHRRLAAARSAGVAEIPVLVRPQPDPAELAELMLAENLQREDLDPIDEALALLEVKRGGRRTVKQIAERVNRSASWVAGRLALVKLPESLWDDVRVGSLPINDAVALAQAPVSAEDRIRLAKSSGSARSWELQQAIASAKKADSLRKAAKAYPGAIVSDAHPGAYNSPGSDQIGPLQTARYGTEPGQINTPPELCGHDHMYVRAIFDGSVEVFNLRPELLPPELFVPLPETDEEDEEADTDEQVISWTDLDLTGVASVGDLDDEVALEAGVARWEMRQVHQHCPNHRVVTAPWLRNPVEVCIAPAAHDVASWTALLEQHRTAPKSADQPGRRRDPGPFEGPEGDQLAEILTALVASIPADLVRALLWIDPYDVGDRDGVYGIPDEDLAKETAASLRRIVDGTAMDLVGPGDYCDEEPLAILRWSCAELTAAGGSVPPSVTDALTALDSAAAEADEEGEPEDGNDGEEDAA